MPHRGTKPSPISSIRQIRQNLAEGRYAVGDSGISIIKELIQNADDAGDRGASFLHLGICDGLANVSHPLLQSPALYVINDGPFEKHDRANIDRLGENSKSLRPPSLAFGTNDFSWDDITQSSYGQCQDRTEVNRSRHAASLM